MTLLKIAIGSVLVLGLAVPVAASDVNMYGEPGTYTLRSGYTYGRGEWGFSLYGNEWDYRVPSDRFWETFDPLWSNWDLTKHRFSAGIGFGLTDRVELDVMLPYDHYHAFLKEGSMHGVGHINGQTFVGRIHQQGLGDLRVGLRFGLVSDDRQGVALNLFATPSTGDDDEAVTTGEFGYGAGLGWSIDNWVVNAGYWDPGDPDIVSLVPISGPTVQGVSPQVQLGIGYAHPFSDRWDWITELSGALMTDSTGEYDTADIASGGRYHFGANEEWGFNFALRLDLSHNDQFSDTDPIGGLIGITYSNAGRLRGDIDRGDRGRREPAEPSRPAAPPAPPAAPPAPSVAADTHTLTVRKAGTGNGTVTSNPAGIDCGSDCRETYPTGTQARLTGTPDTCSTFQGFGGDCASDGSVTMSSDRTCTATFDARPRAAQTFGSCEKYGAWDCQSGLRETVPFANGTAVLAERAAADGRGLLCDWANQLRACPQLRLCVAGSSADSEDECVAAERADTLVEFFRRQSENDAFSGISSRVQAAPSCSPEDEKGSVGNLLLR
jgi:hypothetical protein